MEVFLMMMVFGVVIFGFICFCIYFIFKSLQFVIQATNLYKDMIVRQDAMLKILKDIRDINSGVEPDIKHDVEITTSKMYSQTEIEKNLERNEKARILESGSCPVCGVRTSNNLKQCASCLADFSCYKIA